MTEEQVRVTKAILSTSDAIILKAGFAAHVDETLAGNYVLVYLQDGELTVADSLSQTGHPEGISFPTFSDSTVEEIADLNEEVEMETLITIYVWEVYFYEQRLRLEAMLEAAA